MTIRLTQYLSAIILFFLSQTINAANYYWIGGAGNWGDINHWATTSGGSTLHSFVPTPNDDVFFDGASGFTAVSKVVTVNTNATCRDMTWSGALNNPSLTSGGSNVLNISGLLSLQGGMSYNVANTNFVSTVLGKSIATNNVAIAGIFNFNGTGSWILQDNLSVQGLNCNSGTFNSNSRNVTTTFFNSTGSTTRSLLLGTSIITTAASYGVDHSGTNLTIAAATSTIVMNMSTTNTNLNQFQAASNSVYGDVVFNFAGSLNGSGSSIFNTVLFNGNGRIGGASRFNTLTFSSGFNYEFPTATTNTITSRFNANAPLCGGWISIASAYNPGQQYTISMPATATVNINNCSIQDCNAIGGAVFTATNSVNDGNNSGWAFLTPSVSTLFWIGGSGNWSDGNHWSLSSGGGPSGCVPNPAINAIFDAGSGLTTSSNTITISTVQNCRNLTCNGATTPPNITSPAMATGILNIYGSVMLQAGMTYSVFTNFKSSSVETIQSNGVTFNSMESMYDVVFNGLGSFTTIDAFNVNKAVRLLRGTINTNNQNWFCRSFTEDGFFPTAQKSVTLGASIITLSGSSVYGAWRYENGSLNAGTSHIVILVTGSLFSARTNAPPHTYYDVTFNGTNGLYGGIGTRFHNVLFQSNATIGSISGTGYVFNNLTFSPNTTCSLSSTNTNTINGVFTAYVAPCGGWITMSGGLISMPSTATVNINQVILQSSVVGGGAVFTASNSVDVSGNIGWTFGAVTTNSLYWVGGSGDWNDATHWSTINNGIFPSVSPCVPGPSDDVFFNSNSGLIASSKTVSITASVYCRNITCAGSATPPIILGTPQLGYLNIYGSTLLQAGGTYQVGFVFKASGAETITSNGSTFSSNGFGEQTNQIKFDGSGSWTLMDDFRCGALYLYFKRGTINTNNFNVYCPNFVDKTVSGAPSAIGFRHLNLGSSTIFISGAYNAFGVPWEFMQSNSTINSGTSRIIINNTNNATTQFRTNSSHTYYDIRFTGVGTYAITGSGSNFHNVIFLTNGEMQGNHTFNELTFTGRYTYRLQNGFTQTVTSNFYPSGNPCFITFIRSTNLGLRGNISVQSGAMNYDYVDIQDVDASPSFATFNIAGHSTNSGNNLNMVFAPTTTVGLTGLGPDLTLCQNALPITLNTTNFFPNPVTTYSWTGAITTNSLSVISGGVYSVAVSYAADCVVADGIVITANPTPTITATGTSICGGLSTVLTALGASTYTWVNPSATTNTILVSPSTSTVYTIMGTSPAGCTTTLTNIPVIVNATPTVAIASITNGGVICNGNVVTIIPSGAGVYTLSPTSQTTTTSFVLTPTINTTYSIIGANAGCISNTANTTVTVNALPTVAIASVNSSTLCTGNSSTITPSGASTYTLTSGTTTLTSSPFVVSPTANTTYTIVGTSSANCASANNVITAITVNTTPTVAITSISNATLCSGNASTITASGANTYTLISSTNTLTVNPFVVSPNTNTTYTLVGSSSANCKSTNSLSTLITVNATPTITASGASAGTICTGQVFTITPLGGNTGSYTLTPGNIITSTVFTVSPTTNTTYSINGTNTSGCLSTTSTDLNVPITVNATPTLAAVFSSNALCASQNVTITLSGANGIYTLSPGTLTTPSTTGSFVISPPAGTTVYTITANNSNGCVSTLANQIYTTSVSVVTNPTISVSAITPSVCSGSTASITPFGASSFTLQPNNITVSSGQTFTLVQTAPTTYTINGTATGGCVSIASTQFVTTIGINTTPTIAIASISNASVCAGNQSIITPNGASSYTLFPDNITGTSFTVSPLANTTYSISGTSSDNCNSANQATGLIIVNATPTISLLSITPSSSICAGQSVTITPTGANSNYTIMPLNTNNSTVFVVSPSVTTSYTISGSNTTGCLSTASTDLYTTITVNQTPSITIASQQNALCFGGASGSVTLTPTGGTGTSTITPLGTTNLSVGNYTYTIIDDAGCENTTTVAITEPTNALASSVAEVSANANCTSPNGVASVTVTGGTPTYAIAWSTGEIGSTATSLNTGLSTYTVIDANGCLDNTGSIVLTGVSGITTNAISQNSIACFGTNSGALSFTTTGGGTINYTLTNIATGINTTNTTGIFSGLTAGNYSLTVVGIGGCTTNQLFSLTQPTSAIVISSIVTNSIACFGSTGIVIANVLGGTTPYTYAWQSNTSLTSTASYEAGTYTMTVTDVNNCLATTQTFTLAEPSNSLTITETLLNPSCNNENTGAIEITINGGTPNYTTLWSNGATTNSITQLPVGVITATVTDANNCASFYDATITETVCVTLNVPNFFTPEGDGKNDVLLITGIEQYPNNEVFIFNRWGSLVYSKEKYDNSFDGKPNVSNSNGNGKLPSATYFMIIEFNDSKTKPYKGYIEIKY